jgi:transposase
LVDVEQWAEIRRMRFVLGLPIKEIARRTGRDRNTVRRALRSSTAPRYSRPAAPSKLDPFKDQIHQLLKADAKLTAQRIRELITPLGFDGGKTIVDEYVRGVRPLPLQPGAVHIVHV